MFKTLDNWTFDPFKFNELTGGHTLRYLGHELFIRYDLMAKFKVSKARCTNSCSQTFRDHSSE